MKKLLTKKYWQIVYANFSMFMFRWCYDWKSAIKFVINGLFTLPIILSIGIPLIIIARIEEFVRTKAISWVVKKLHLDMDVNPKWDKMTRQEMIDRWKTWKD
jgi:hypothetical protein